MGQGAPAGWVGGLAQADGVLQDLAEGIAGGGEA